MPINLDKYNEEKKRIAIAEYREILKCAEIEGTAKARMVVEFIRNNAIPLEDEAKLEQILDEDKIEAYKALLEQVRMSGRGQRTASPPKQITINKLPNMPVCAICGGQPTHIINYRDPENPGPEITGPGPKPRYGPIKSEHSCDKCIVQTTQLILTKIGLGI